jgi:hypothetical protein
MKGQQFETSAAAATAATAAATAQDEGRYNGGGCGWMMASNVRIEHRFKIERYLVLHTTLVCNPRQHVPW